MGPLSLCVHLGPLSPCDACMPHYATSMHGSSVHSLFCVSCSRTGMVPCASCSWRCFFGCHTQERALSALRKLLLMEQSEFVPPVAVEAAEAEGVPACLRK